MDDTCEVCSCDPATHHCEACGAAICLDCTAEDSYVGRVCIVCYEAKAEAERDNEDSDEFDAQIVEIF